MRLKDDWKKQRFSSAKMSIYLSRYIYRYSEATINIVWCPRRQVNKKIWCASHFTRVDETRTFLEMDTRYTSFWYRWIPFARFDTPFIVTFYLLVQMSLVSAFSHPSPTSPLSSPLLFQLGIYIFDKYDALIRIPAALLLPVSTNYLLFNYTAINVCAEKLMTCNCHFVNLM